MQYKQDNSLKGSINKLIQDKMSKTGMTSYESKVIQFQQQYSDPKDKNQIVGDTKAGVRRLEVAINSEPRKDKLKNKGEGLSGDMSVGVGEESMTQEKQTLIQKASTVLDGVTSLIRNASESVSAMLKTSEKSSTPATQPDGTQNVASAFMIVEHMDANGHRVQKCVRCADSISSGVASSQRMYTSSYDMKNKIIATDIVAVGIAGNLTFGMYAPSSISVGGSSNIQVDKNVSSINPSVDNFDSFIQKYATSKIPASLIKAIISQESAGDPNATSWCGAQGLMQLMPGTASDIAFELGIVSFDAYDPETNIKFGAHYLETLYDMLYSQYGWEGVIAGYNAGPGAVQDNGGIPPYPETQNYVQMVKGYWKQ